MTVYDDNFKAALHGAEDTMNKLREFPEEGSLSDFEIDQLYRMSAELWGVCAQLEAYIASRTGTMDTA